MISAENISGKNLTLTSTSRGENPPGHITTASLFYANDRGRLTRWYEGMSDWVEATCINNGICEHGLRHHELVSQIGKFLTRIVILRADIILKDNDAPVQDLWRQILSGDFMFLSGKFHHLGYPFSTWSGFDAPNHAAKAPDVFNEIADNVLPAWVESRDNGEKEALVRVKTMRQLLSAGMSATTDSALKTTEELLAENYLDPVQFAGVFVKVADNFDRYRQSRVLRPGVNVPDRYDINPYYYLAASVKKYILSYEKDEALNYRAEIDPAVMSFDRWYEEIRRHDSNVWQLAENFSWLLGLNFHIEQAKSV